LFNATIRAWQSGKKININDVLCDAELAELARERLARNGNGEPERVICQCAEGIINGQRMPVHRPADCKYAEARSALIFEASQIATERIGDPINSAAVGYKWTAEFVRQMDRLVFNAGLLR
jgi:hypothetical protein